MGALPAALLKATTSSAAVRRRYELATPWWFWKLDRLGRDLRYLVNLLDDPTPIRNRPVERRSAGFRQS